MEMRRKKKKKKKKKSTLSFGLAVSHMHL